MRALVAAGLVGLAGAGHAQERVVVRGPGAGSPPPPELVAPPPAPEGLATYQRPVRGQFLPTYWQAPRFRIDDWARHELPQPPAGYAWVRYFDGAALLDPRGAVYDYEPEVDWDRFDGASADARPAVPPAAAVRTYTVPAGRSHTVFAGPGVTTITVTTQPAVTTAATEVRDEAVTYSRPRAAPRAAPTKLRRR